MIRHIERSATELALQEKGDVVYSRIDDWATRLKAAAAALDAVVAEMRSEEEEHQRDHPPAAESG